MKKKITSIIMIFVLSAAASVSAADISAGNGKITASDVTEGSSLITALYRDGVMVQSKLHKGSGTITADPAADFGELSNTDTIKAFLWDMDTIKPLCNALTTNIQEINERDNKVTVTINGKQFNAVLYENETAEAFKSMLPMTITMNELNGNEKYYYFNQSLPTNSARPGTIREGDLMLYGSSCLVLFYETFQSSYSYTKIGYIEDTTGLQNALGSGNVTVRYE